MLKHTHQKIHHHKSALATLSACCGVAILLEFAPAYFNNMSQPTVLVLQHPQLSQCDLAALSFLPAFVKSDYLFNQTTLRMPVTADFRLPEQVGATLMAQHIDFAILPDLPFEHLGLIVSDMDSTFITIECVDEIAAGVGLKDQVTAITERSMRGELDFEASLRARVALLKGLPEGELQYVYEHVLQPSPGAAWLLKECKQHGVKFMLVSGGFTYFTERLRQKYGLDYAFANQLTAQAGQLTGTLSGQIIDAQAKADLLAEYTQKLDLQPNQTLAMGDGANDIPMIQAAGFGVAYHAKPKTQAAANIQVRFGGLDVVRKWFR